MQASIIWEGRRGHAPSTSLIQSHTHFSSREPNALTHRLAPVIQLIFWATNSFTIDKDRTPLMHDESCNPHYLLMPGAQVRACAVRLDS